jgi:transcriptional regulator with XRE-family HTH domain
MSQKISLVKLGSIVRKKRDKKYTQEQLGLKTGINRNIIRLIERAQHLPSIPQLNKLMEVLDFTFEDIIEEDNTTDVFVAMMGQAETPEEKEGFEIMIERMLCLMKYQRLKQVYKF